MLVDEKLFHNFWFKLFHKDFNQLSNFAHQIEMLSSLHMSAYCFKYFRCVSIKFSLIVLKFSMYIPVDLVYFFLKKCKYAANLHCVDIVTINSLPASPPMFMRRKDA